MEEETLFEIEGANLSLADLAGINMDEIAEKRGGAFPSGIFDFEVTAAPLGEVGDKKKYPAVEAEFKILDVVKLDAAAPGEETPDANSLVGSTYKETIIIGSADNLGSMKAFVVDTGGKGSGRLVEMLEAWVGCRFRGRIKHRKSKNDEDVKFARLVRNKVKPLAEVLGNAA